MQSLIVSNSYFDSNYSYFIIQYNTIKFYSTVEQTATVYIVLRNKAIEMTTNQYVRKQLSGYKVSILYFDG